MARPANCNTTVIRLFPQVVPDSDRHDSGRFVPLGSCDILTVSFNGATNELFLLHLYFFFIARRRIILINCQVTLSARQKLRILRSFYEEKSYFHSEYFQGKSLRPIGAKISLR